MDSSKHNLLVRFLEAWETVPELRMGQLIENAMSRAERKSLFFTNDEDLIVTIEDFVEDRRPVSPEVPAYAQH